MPNLSTSYKWLISSISWLLAESRGKVVRQVNSILVETYRHIGKQIVEFEQWGKKKAEYGDQLLKKMAKDLQQEFGRGFSWRNLYNIRQFFLTYPKLQSVIAKSQRLTRTHFLQLITISDDDERSFYEIECEKSNWSVRELRRQMNTALYDRLALSKNKQEVKDLSKKGQLLQKPKDLIKEPYFLEFLWLSENAEYSESDLEKAIIDDIWKFLLELWKGFAFIGRQQRISNGPDHRYVDLVFYNRLLRCFLLIDLKIWELTHKDIGQMQMYVNRYDREVKDKEENPTIGLILSKFDNKFVVKYTLPKSNEQIFARQYRLYLPNKKELKKELEKLL